MKEQRRIHSQSLKPQVRKVFQRYQYKLKNKTRHTNVIHVTIRSQTKSIPSFSYDLNSV